MDGNGPQTLWRITALLSGAVATDANCRGRRQLLGPPPTAGAAAETGAAAMICAMASGGAFRENCP